MKPGILFCVWNTWTVGECKRVFANTFAKVKYLIAFLVSSLDRISKDFGPVRVDVLGKITESVLAGLVYLYEAHRIMHRDIKPSNILVNSRGNIKLCDFGVATETVNSIADTFVGTSTYMAPERIQGGAYTVRSMPQILRQETELVLALWVSWTFYNRLSMSPPRSFQKAMLSPRSYTSSSPNASLRNPKSGQRPENYM